MDTIIHGVVHAVDADKTRSGAASKFLAIMREVTGHLDRLEVSQTRVVEGKKGVGDTGIHTPLTPPITLCFDASALRMGK